jgi:uncharacterized protein YjbI with pentapeptide repeats
VWPAPERRLVKANVDQAPAPLAPAHEGERKVALHALGISKILERHRDWLDSHGEAGIQADFSRENLEGADLIDARLQDALLNKTILKRSELILADLRGASLLQADLREANLLGTQFQRANLQAAILKDSTGLVSAQLAGSNLLGAALPEAISPLAEMRNVSQVAMRAAWLLAAQVALNIVVWLRIFTTRDGQLLKDAPALPFFGLQADLPYIPFYLFGPVVILCVYVWFHLYVQRLWDGASQMPAIFQDGRTLDRCLPWFARWPVQTHCKWLQGKRSPLAFLEAAIATLLLYWVAPVTVVLFWGRYLKLQDLRGSAFHVLLVAGAVIAALNFPKMAGRAFTAHEAPLETAKQRVRKIVSGIEKGVLISVGVFLLLVSVGTVLGIPHDNPRNVDPGPAQIKKWAGQILWIAGYNPFAQLTEVDVSTKPPGWSGRDEDLVKVSGANLNRRRLRFIQGYGAFLAKAHLWRADLGHAYLSEADLRYANLRQADLQFAILDSAKLKGATMQDVDMRNAVLDRADMQQANLSSAILSNVTLLDAKLDGANLYKADMRSDILKRTTLKQADLREANLENTDLTMANLQEAYLGSTKLGNAKMIDAELPQAILTDADLRRADLSGANLQGAVMQGVDLSGANLQGANLHGAVGITPAQICSAANFSQAQFDESLRSGVDTTCGSYRSLFPAPQAGAVPGSTQSSPRFAAPVQLR